MSFWKNDEEPYEYHFMNKKMIVEGLKRLVDGIRNGENMQDLLKDVRDICHGDIECEKILGHKKEGCNGCPCEVKNSSGPDELKTSCLLMDFNYAYRDPRCFMPPMPDPADSCLKAMEMIARWENEDESI